MDNGEEIYEEIAKWMVIFNDEATKFYGKENQAAGVRARKALDRICKMKVEWKKATIHGTRG